MRSIKEVTEENQRLKLHAQNLADLLEKTQQEHESQKNRVSGGFHMVSKIQEENLRKLQQKSSTARLLFSYICQKMKIGTNQATLKNKDIAEALGLSTRTIQRASNVLVKTRFVEIKRHLGGKQYTVNPSVTFAGRPAQRQSISFKHPEIDFGN